MADDVKKVEEKAPAEKSTPKVRWWNKLVDGIGESAGKWFVDR